MRHESRGTKDQLIIDQGIIKDFKIKDTLISPWTGEIVTRKKRHGATYLDSHGLPPVKEFLEKTIW